MEAALNSEPRGLIGEALRVEEEEGKSLRAPAGQWGCCKCLHSGALDSKSAVNDLAPPWLLDKKQESKRVPDHDSYYPLGHTSGIPLTSQLSQLTRG